MAQRDAFGREPGEDPFAAMGWQLPAAVVAPSQARAAARRAEDASARAAAAAAPVRAGTAGAWDAAEGQRAQTARRVRAAVERSRAARATGRPAAVPGLRVVRWVVLLVVLAVLAGPVLSVVSTVRDVVGDVRETPIGALPEGTGEQGGARDDAAPAGPPARDASFLARPGLTSAVAALRRAGGGGRPVYVRVAAASVDAQVLSGDRLRILRVERGAPAEVLATSDDGSTLPPFAWSAVAPAAVERLARLDGFEAATLVDVQGLRWTVTAGTATWTAGPDGRGAERLGGG